MLKIIRHKGFMKKVLWFLAVVIILSFGFFGQSFLFRDSKRITYAGKIFNEKISIQEYDFNRLQTIIQLTLQYGEALKNIANNIDIYAQTWDRIILLHEARKRNISATDEEVVAAIQKYPYFQNLEDQGQFNQRLYEQVLNHYFRIKPRDFEEGMRDTIKISKLFERETDGIHIPDQDVLDVYTRRNEKVQVSYILFSADQYLQDIAFDEIQAKNYYLSHKQDFQFPPMINVEFIRIDFPKEETPESPAGGDIPAQASEAEQGDTEDFNDPPIKEETREITWEKAQTIADAIIVDGQDFHDVARHHGLSAGESGFFSKEKPNLALRWSFPLIQKLFDIPPGQVLGPIETPEGYQVLRVKELREAYVPDYPQAQKEVKEAWIREQAREKARRKADEALVQIQQALNQPEPFSLKTAAENLNFPLFQTPVFQRGEYLPQVGLSPAFQEAAFAMKNGGQLSHIIETEKGFCLLALDSFIPVNMDEYEKEKGPYQRELAQQKKGLAFSEFLTQLRLKANLVDHTPELYRLNTAEDKE